MAMKNLVEGECGTSNSLLKFTSHFTQDKAFKQEGFYGPIHRPSSVVDKPLAEEARDVEWTDEFIRGCRTQAAPETFHMSSLLQEMRQIEEAELFHEPQTAPAIADLASSDLWMKEFLSTEKPTTDDGEWSQFPSAEITSGNAEIKWAEEYLEHNDHRHWMEDYTKELIDSDCRFDEMSENLAGEFSEIAKELSSNPKMKNSEFMKFVENLSSDHMAVKESQAVDKTTKDAEDWVDQFTDQQNAKPLVDQWQEEFVQQTGSKDLSEEAFWKNLEKHWEDVDKQSDHPWLTEYEKTDPFKEYMFSEDNPLLNHHNPFQAGLEKLEQGDIPNAVLLFEAAVRQNDKHVEAWQYLGTTQAENEQEPSAIAALRQCLDLDQENLTAWMSLAVSYTNESLQPQACNALKAWLRHNPRYFRFVQEDTDHNSSADVSSYLPRSRMMEVRDMYIEAARLSPDEIDPDVQCGLGVLFNLSGDLDKAVDCFTAALQLRPKDPHLWNRLGATLANNNKSEEAVNAYHNALELSPGFIRARYNLGIACINLGVYRDAVEHFLLALNMQQQSKEPKDPKFRMSQNIWGTMRMAISFLGQHALHEACDNYDLDRLNKAFQMNS